MKRFDKTYSLNCGVKMKVRLGEGNLLADVSLKANGMCADFVQAGNSNNWHDKCVLLIGVTNISSLITALQELQQFIQEGQNDT